MNGITSNCNYDIKPTENPCSYSSYPYPELNYQPTVCPEHEKHSTSSRSTSWLKYLFAVTFCILLIAFITFLVLFIVAVSTGGFTKSGRLINADVENVEKIINLNEKIADFVKHDFKKSESSFASSLIEKIKKFKI